MLRIRAHAHRAWSHTAPAAKTDIGEHVYNEMALSDENGERKFSLRPRQEREGVHVLVESSLTTDKQPDGAKAATNWKDGTFSSEEYPDAEKVDVVAVGREGDASDDRLILQAVTLHNGHEYIRFDLDHAPKGSDGYDATPGAAYIVNEEGRVLTQGVGGSFALVNAAQAAQFHDALQAFGY